MGAQKNFTDILNENLRESLNFDSFQGQSSQSDQNEDSLYQLLQEFIAENNSLKESNRID